MDQIKIGKIIAETIRDSDCRNDALRPDRQPDALPGWQFGFLCVNHRKPPRRVSRRGGFLNFKRFLPAFRSPRGEFPRRPKAAQ